MTKESKTVVNCIVCREDIRPQARKCIHCDSFQDWRRYLTFSNTVLALLVALVSVSTVLVPILGNFIKKDVSNLSVTYHGVHENLFNLVATNTGSKDGVIVQEDLTLHNDNTKTLAFKLEPRFDQIIVPGGATRQSTTRLNPLDFPRFLSWLKSNNLQKATLYVRAENHGAGDWKSSFDVELYDIATIRAYAEQSQPPINQQPRPGR